ncbi:MAG: hypothetical protein N2053_04725 [Chitinispirillaceae bacterium]|nr:hypothetical protein [Chitinispirillaceae bacterium]
MSKKICSLGLIVIASIFCSYGDLITFDDVAWGPYDAYVEIPNQLHRIGDGYHGFNWDQFGVCNGKNFAPGSGYENGIVSGEWVGYNLWSNVATIDGKPFNFESAYLTSVWIDNLSVNIKGLKNGTEIYNQTVIVNTDAPTYFEFNFKNIDQLIFSSDVHFVIDNFSYSNVAEPNSFLSIFMGLLGFLGITGFSKRRK